MKRSLPLITSLLLSSLLFNNSFFGQTVWGQNVYDKEKVTKKSNILSIDNQNVFVKGSPENESIMACVTITNNHPKALEIVWKRVAESYSNDYWESYVIDDKIEWAPFVEEGTLTLEAYESVDLCINFLSSHREGEGKITLELHNNLHKNWREPIEFTANLDWESDKQSTNNIRIYPNKAESHVHIDWRDVDETISQLEVHNLIGKKINTFVIQNQDDIYTINVKTFEAGVYFISIFNESVELVSTQAFSKIN